MGRAAAALITFIFVLSGIAALVFETLWFRQASIAFGSSVWASALVLSSFMAGTAAGNGLAARHEARVRRPVLFYAGLELAIGTSGLAIVLLLPHAGGAFGALLSPFLLPTSALSAARFGVAFLVLAAPAVAMGATLPTLVKALSNADLDFGRLLGRLYGWNTLGAVIGAVAAELLLIPSLGITGAGFAAASLNVLAAVLAFALTRKREAAPADSSPPQRAGSLDLATARLLLGAFLSGAILLALEVVWFRILVLSLPQSTEAFAWMLAVVLSGIGLGGLAAALLLRVHPKVDHYVAIVALVSGVLAMQPYAALPSFSDRLAAVPPDDALALLGLAVPLMLPASLSSGVLFTLLGRRIQQRIGQPMRAAGLLTLSNTLGAGLGPLLAGFVLLPLLGMEQSLFSLSACYALVAVCAWPPRKTQPALWSATVATTALLLASTAAFPFGMMKTLMEERIGRGYNSTEHIIASREAVTGTLTYTQADFLGEPYYHRLTTDGFSMSGNGISAQRYMSLFVYLPFAFHHGPRDALLISYGVGTTASTLAEARALETIDVVDISRATLEMSDLVFEEGESPLLDPRVTVFIEDGRYFLQTTSSMYDLITAEPPPPAAAGVVNLYTQEYFELLRSRLREGGVVSYWLPVAQFSLPEAQAIVKAFCAVFDDCTLWEGIPQDWILLGTVDSPGFLTEATVRRQWRDDRSGPRLRARGIENAEQLGALFLGDADMLRSWTADAEPLVDNWPHRAPRWALPRVKQPHFDALMEPRGAASRFANSLFIKKMWPAPLRTSTLRYFEYEALIRDHLMTGVGVTIPKLHRLLRETPLETLPLWLLGSDEDKQAIVRKLALAETDARTSTAADYHLGLAALAARDYDEASERLAKVPVNSDYPRAAHYRLYALSMAGRLDDAQRFAAVFPDARAPANLRYWAFIETTFGIER